VAAAENRAAAHRPPAIRRAPRTLLTPHIAGSTTEAQTNVAVDVARQVLEVLADDVRPAVAARAS